jgi:hypothetical protein
MGGGTVAEGGGVALLQADRTMRATASDQLRRMTRFCSQLPRPVPGRAREGPLFALRKPELTMRKETARQTR